PRTLEPLLQKRITFKQLLAELPPNDPKRAVYKVRASAHKWLLVTCFGYLGYKNARFGRIESHEAVTNGGREALLAAKEAAEELGFEVLHMYVDGLWLKKKGASQVKDFQPVLEAIVKRTSLPIALEGIYRWVAFLPSRVDERVPVPNRYFGVFQDGSYKVRGIEARRRDSPKFVAEVQMELLEYLGQGKNIEEARARVPAALNLLRRRMEDLRTRQVPPEKLLVGQKLSRAIEKYTDPSPAAQAAMQLQGAGRNAEPGQRLYFIYTLGRPGVHAWDLPQAPNPASIDAARYIELLLRAASAIFQPFGVDEDDLRARMDGWGYRPAPLFAARPRQMQPAGI
ncbi:MAG: hypothetical protein HGA86_05470, partial [Anaerolineaceae bacterium]|nr:hypothetical protein [Anaerolineaceae bacterium]